MTRRATATAETGARRPRVRARDVDGGGGVAATPGDERTNERRAMARARERPTTTAIPRSIDASIDEIAHESISISIERRGVIDVTLGAEAVSDRPHPPSTPSAVPNAPSLYDAQRCPTAMPSSTFYRNCT